MPAPARRASNGQQPAIVGFRLTSATWRARIQERRCGRIAEPFAREAKLKQRVAFVLLAPAIAAVIAILVAPLAYLLSFSVLATGSGMQPRFGFTLANV